MSEECSDIAWSSLRSCGCSRPTHQTLCFQNLSKNQKKPSRNKNISLMIFGLFMSDVCSLCLCVLPNNTSTFCFCFSFFFALAMSQYLPVRLTVIFMLMRPRAREMRNGGVQDVVRKFWCGRGCDVTWKLRFWLDFHFDLVFSFCLDLTLTLNLTKALTLAMALARYLHRQCSCFR